MILNLALISTLLVMIFIYINRVLSIMVNVTSCNTCDFDRLLNNLKENKLLAINTKEKFNSNYKKREEILKELNYLKKNRR